VLIDSASKYSSGAGAQQTFSTMNKAIRDIDYWAAEGRRHRVYFYFAGRAYLSPVAQ
jgi:hypothetical protein